MVAMTERRDADFVIIGAGPAAVTAAELLRRQAPASRVLMINAEKSAPYARMAIPYMLSGRIDEQGTHLRKREGHFAEAGIEMVNETAADVDAKKRTVTLENGGICGYGALLVASGASPVSPPIEGMGLSNIYNCWTLADARAIAARVRPGAEVLLMGAGFIGCIILEALISRGARVTIVEAEERMVPRMMDEQAGAMLKSWCRTKGADVRTGVRVAGFERSGKRISASFDGGDGGVFDLVVVAAGVRPNTGFLASSDIEIDQGIKVDAHMQTNAGGVYAAGDCAQGPDFSTGGSAVHAIQPTAVEHGRIAALNMSGTPVRYRGSLNMNVLDTAGLVSASFGAWNGVDGGEFARSLDRGRFRYIRLAFEEERLIGAVTVGCVQAIGILRGLIQSRLPLGKWKERLMRDPGLWHEAYVDCVLGQMGQA